MTQEALRMAHKALIGLSIKHGEMTDEGIDAIAAIEKALAKEKALQALHDENERLGLYKDAYAEQEPMACIYKGYLYMAHEFQSGQVPVDSQPLYTAPPQND